MPLRRRNEPEVRGAIKLYRSAETDEAAHEDDVGGDAMRWMAKGMNDLKERITWSEEQGGSEGEGGGEVVG